jgi:hypothetical protein
MLDESHVSDGTRARDRASRQLGVESYRGGGGDRGGGGGGGIGPQQPQQQQRYAGSGQHLPFAARPVMQQETWSRIQGVAASAAAAAVAAGSAPATATGPGTSDAGTSVSGHIHSLAKARETGERELKALEDTLSFLGNGNGNGHGTAASPPRRPPRRPPPPLCTTPWRRPHGPRPHPG